MRFNAYICTGWAIASLFTAQEHATGATLCVSTEAELSTALQLAEATAEDNDIRIRTGQYSAPVGGWHIDLVLGDYDFSLTGGYIDATCTQRTFDAFVTVLDGHHELRPLTIDTSYSAINPDHHIYISGLTFQNGRDAAVGALKVSDTGPIYGGTILIEGNAFVNNETFNASFEGAPALLAATDGPDFSGGVGLVIRNNLFANNTGPDIPAAFLFSNNRIEFVGNTIVGNRALDMMLAERSSVDYFTFTGIGFSNNIFWHNAPPGEIGTYDLIVTQEVDLLSNDIETFGGSPGSDIGTLRVDPAFVDSSNGDYSLDAASGVIDRGTDAPPGGVSAFDLAGAARIQGARIDIGAYEVASEPADSIFRNGFDTAP